MPNFKQSRGYKMKGFSGFKGSPAKMYGKKSPAKKELIGGQHNLPEELKAKIKAAPGKMYGKKSPAKQEGPIDKKQMGLQKGEMEGTSVYSGKDKSERMIDLEDRIEFLSSDIEGGSDRPGQNMSDMKKARKRLQHELDIMMNRKGSGVKKGPVKPKSGDMKKYSDLEKYDDDK